MKIVSLYPLLEILAEVLNPSDKDTDATDEKVIEDDRRNRSGQTNGCGDERLSDKRANDGET